MSSHCFLRGSESCDHSTAARIFENPTRDVSSFHFASGEVMQGFASAVHRTQQSIFVGLPSHAWKDFGYSDPGNFGADWPQGASHVGDSVRFHVPGINLARTTGEH